MAQAEVKVVATLDNAPFKAGISGMSSQLAGMKGIIAGAFSVGAILSYGKNLLEVAHQMEIIAGATNLTMGQLVALKTVSAENGMNMEKLSIALGRVRDAQGQVVSLAKPMTDALVKLGIDAKAFIGVGTDEALAMIAKGFVDAGGSAEAFSAVKDILGKSSKDTIEMLKALNAEGLEPLIERTKDAADAARELADMKGDMEKFFNSVQDGSIRALAGVIELGKGISETANRLKSDRGIFGAIKDFFTKSKGPVFGMDEWTGQPEAKRPSKAFGPPAPAKINPDIATFEENQRKAAQKELDSARKVMDGKLKADESESRKLDEMYRSQDELAVDFAKKRKDLMAGKGIEVPDRARVDSLQAIGGIIGGVAGRGDQAARIAERQAKSTEAIETLMRETNGKLDDLNRKMDGIISE